ncbi:methyl-accepting chemotaxis protein [Massilia rhizosphaerae]|uniref:methyl-accepting chemotaxis protein n=1 Tax=Massilia rhizosphaerae TaxID=2784389 RepID=UPI0027D9752F|nr:methyl-accepting chemotaxis protein [Massilia rhizosphaerae]
MFKEMKVGTRLALSFLAVVAVGAIVAGIGVYNMAQMNERAKLMYERELLGISYIKDASLDQAFVVRALRGALLASTDERRAESLANMDKYQQMMQDSLGKARPLFHTDDGKRNFAAVEAQLREFDDMLPELIKRMKAEPLDQKRGAVDYMFDNLAPRSRSVDVKMRELSLDKEKLAQANNLYNKGEYESSRATMLVLVALSALTGVIFGILITRSLTRQLGGEPAYAAEVAGRIAGGDLRTDVQLRAGDDTSLLFAMKSMRDHLARIVSEVRHGTDAIASASGEIASGNLDLSSRTEEQASSLEETASSMEELTSTVKQNADNARQANVLAQTASSVAGQGGDVVAQVVQTMGSINDSSKKIVDIITVIDGIAFQTNILALNAAVEAARAGEQGRGFAVVAGEVRTLAQRSAAAAKEIKTLIGDSVDKVAVGTKLVDQAGSTMTEVVASIQRVTDIMAEISAASLEQTGGIEQINQAISQMDNVTQQNASLVEEAAAASEALQSQAVKLSELVSVFQIDGGAPAAAPKRPVRAEPVMTALAPPSAKPVLRVVKPAPARAPVKAAATAGADDWEEF